jgi:hypothetical protein
VDIKSSREPWLWQPRLRNWVNTNWESWSSWVADTKYSLIDWRAVTAWWDTTFSWFGFRPKKVQVHWLSTIWIWYEDDDWNITNVTSTLTANSVHLIWLETWWSKITWKLKEFTDDWFIVTWDIVDTITVGMYATCYSNI